MAEKTHKFVYLTVYTDSLPIYYQAII